MPVLDIRTWPRRNVPGLGLTDRDIGLLRGVDCDIMAQCFSRIYRIVIPLRYTFFSRNLTVKNSEVKRA
jgi:hypothetical protein